MKVPDLYLIDENKLKSGQVSVYLHSAVIIPNNHNFTSRIVDMTMFYGDQNHENQWTDPHCS